MSYFNKRNSKPYFDISNYKPVSVIVNFSKSGAFIPVYFGIEVHNEFKKFKISSIVFERDYPGYKQFFCKYESYSRIYETLLMYDIKDHRWYSI